MKTLRVVADIWEVNTQEILNKSRSPAKAQLTYNLLESTYCKPDVLACCPSDCRGPALCILHYTQYVSLKVLISLMEEV